MLLRVVHQDGKYDYVTGAMLTLLLEAGDIALFERSSGWVPSSSAQVRKAESRVGHNGPERRLQ